ncbi:MAG: hypothetical protein ACRC3Y_14345, partial [Romboutsia sp.]|uniref:hypothetical protein n=1 Tax=Romboutsia sp. TaxID=1965302 RepID=UPI003F33AE4C
NDNLMLDDINSFKYHKKFINLDDLVQFLLNILTDLDYLKKSIKDIYLLSLLQGLTYNYFNFISSIQYFPPVIYYRDSHLKPRKDLENNIRFFNLTYDFLNDNSDDLNIDSIRQISIDAIITFLDYSFNIGNIIDEYYEVFFENNKTNKFYQYFIKTDNKAFKIRISENTKKVFYLYSYLESITKVSSPIGKDKAHKLIEKYLQEKFKDEFKNLLFDKDYVITSTYDNVIESYKFKYNYKYNSGKINLNKGFYIVINTSHLNIEEISIF